MSKIKSISIILAFCLAFALVMTMCLSLSTASALANSDDEIVLIYALEQTLTYDYENHELDVYADKGGFASYQITVALPSFAEVTNVQAQTFSLSALVTYAHEDNSATVVYSSVEDIEEGDLLFTVYFDFAEEPEDGDYGLVFSNMMLTSASMEEVNCSSSEEDCLHISSNLIKGDFNGDGVVSVKDAMAMQRYIANVVYGNAQITDAQFAAGDINGDEIINILDVQYVREYLVGIIDSLDDIGEPITEVEYTITYAIYLDDLYKNDYEVKIGEDKIDGMTYREKAPGDLESFIENPNWDIKEYSLSIVDEDLTLDDVISQDVTINVYFTRNKYHIITNYYLSDEYEGSNEGDVVKSIADNFGDLANDFAEYYLDGAEYDLVLSSVVYEPNDITAEDPITQDATINLYFDYKVYEHIVNIYVGDHLENTRRASSPSCYTYGELAGFAANFFIGSNPTCYFEEENYTVTYSEGINEDTLVSVEGSITITFVEIRTYEIYTATKEDNNISFELGVTLEEIISELTGKTITVTKEVKRWSDDYVYKSEQYTLVLSADNFDTDYDYILDVTDTIYIHYIDAERHLINIAVELYIAEPTIIAEGMIHYMFVEDWAHMEIYSDGTVKGYMSNGLLDDMVEYSCEVLEKNGTTIYALSYVGEEACDYFILTDTLYEDTEYYMFDFYRHPGDDDSYDLYTLYLANGQINYQYRVYGDGMVECFIYNSDLEDYTFQVTESGGVEDGIFTIYKTQYSVDQDHGLFIAVPEEENLLFETPFILWSDNTTLQFYNNQVAYRIWNHTEAIGYYSWDYTNEDENVIALELNGTQYLYKWAIDNQWHFTSNNVLVERLTCTEYTLDGQQDYVVFIYTGEDLGNAVIIKKDGRATFASIEDENILVSNDYLNVRDYYIITGATSLVTADKFGLVQKYTLYGNAYEIYEYTGEVVLSGNREGGYAAFLGMDYLYNGKFPHFLMTYAITLENDTEYYVLSYNGTEMFYLYWNEEQNRFFIVQFDDLLYDITLHYVDGEEKEADGKGLLYLFIDNVSELIGKTFVAADGTNYVITGAYSDANRTVPYDALFAVDDIHVYVTVNKLTVSDIISAANSLEVGASLPYEVILSGVVTNVVEYSTNYRNATFTIKVDGYDYSVYCFRVTPAYGCDSISYIAVGDTVTIKGTLQNYNGQVQFNSTSKVTSYEWNQPEGYGSITIDLSAMTDFDTDADVYFYVWYADGRDNANWPGVKLTKVDGTYTAQLDTSKRALGFVLAKVVDSVVVAQTNNIDIPNNGSIALTDSDIKAQ